MALWCVVETGMGWIKKHMLGLHARGQALPVSYADPLTNAFFSAILAFIFCKLILSKIILESP